MSTGEVILLVAAVAAVFGVLGFVLRSMMTRKRLQQRFGPEYDRAIDNGADRRSAERELAEREKRHGELDLRALSGSDRERYSQEWTVVQERFVDAPQAAVAEADQLVVAVMAARGYPTEGYAQQLADLSVAYSRSVHHYRSAHETVARSRNGEATTEELREAMVHYRSLFEDLLGHQHKTRDDVGRNPGQESRA